MSFFVDSFLAAINLVFSLDKELFEVVGVSLRVSTISTLCAAVAGIPLGFLVAYGDIPGKRVVITLLNTMLALPTVVIGLFVYAFISRRGIFGVFDLLYTQNAIVVGQVFLITPLVAALTVAAVSRIDERYSKTAKTLGASTFQTLLVILREAQFGICAAVISAFGRVISEIGISMMLGGNIKGFTRTMTTAMALEYDKGAFTLAIALGLVLMTISLLINILFNVVQGRGRL
ncbi:MAG: ABC transporter permease [Desulfobulbus propionicus]|nr:MAG: ABC transporter permease [Desulfobulbus propionicus]